MLVKVYDVFPWLIATECAGRGLGCVVVVSEFPYFDCIIIYLHIILSSIFNCSSDYLLTLMKILNLNFRNR